MRKRGRTDRNQAEIVYNLRKAGCSVQDLHSLGDGCPDLLVARGGDTWLMEIKDGMSPPSKRLLTEDEIRWHRNWQAKVYVVESIADALKVVGL